MALRGKVLIIVENLPVPFDRRVWQEATTLKNAGYRVSVICPKGRGFQVSHEVIDDIHVYRHHLPFEADNALGYCLEYFSALFWEFVLSWRVLMKHGFDVIHACNPPDNIFIIGLFYKIFFKKRFIFDHHDINPELYIAKFNRKDALYYLLLFLERCTFACSDISIATNESYKSIAVQRGKMDPKKVFVVRSGPDLNRLKILPPNIDLKKGKRYLVGYVGVMGKQEGIDILLRSINIITNQLHRKDIHFGLVGGGTELELMKSYAAELEITDYVTFTGRVPDKDMLEMLNTADLCVNPDIVNEMNNKSTMNKIMEYMALGKPIVQFEMTEGRVSAQESSKYAKPNDEFDFAEKILELLDDEKERYYMGEFGRKRVVNELAWIYEAPILLSAYDKLFE